jgi:hypothetical protein
MSSDHCEQNFHRHIATNPYPGRGLLIGRASSDNGWIMIYWIMGRSAHSRNRMFVAENGLLRTVPVDPSLVADPSLIIYEAMLELPGLYIVTNGDQTRDVYEAMRRGLTFDAALSAREREPDAPNYTPRISGLLDLRETRPVVAFNILKASPFNPDHTDRITFHTAPCPPGAGRCLTTYMGDGSPLPPFQGDPLTLPCKGAPEDVMETYWNALNEDNRIALAVKYIPDAGGKSRLIVKNQFGQG